MDKPILLEMKGIVKSFGGVKALKGVNIELRKGEILALVGENGAGKSTLIKSLMGIHKMDCGEVILDGKRVVINSPLEAVSLGISTVFQELAQIPSLTVAENVFLSREKTHGIALDRKTMFAQTEALLKEYNISIAATDVVSDLSIAQRQMAEIIRCVATNPQIIILDEPTSALTKYETETLFRIIQLMQSKGTSIIYISHRMDEIFEIADRITVLRDGDYVGDLDAKNTTLDEVVNYMVGRKVNMDTSKVKKDFSHAEVVLEAKNVGRKGSFENINLKVHKGEILGLAGLVGAGRSELMQMLFGIDSFDSGELIVNGKTYTKMDVPTAISNHMAMVPEERLTQGLVLSHSIEQNISMSIIERITKMLVVNRKKMAELADRMIGQFSIKAENREMLCSHLSGGNQQKVVLSKWIATNPTVLILDEPTAGIDVRSKFEIREKIQEFADAGMAVILISSELPELLDYSDRILVLNENRIIAEMRETTQEEIMSIILKDKAKNKKLGVA